MNQQNRTLFVVLGVLVVFLLLGPLLMGGMMGPGLFGPGMMGWGFTGGNAATSGNGWLWGLVMGVGGLMMLAFWARLLSESFFLSAGLRARVRARLAPLLRALRRTC